MQKNFYVMRTNYMGYAEVFIENDQTVWEKCPMCSSIFEERKHEILKLHFLGKREGDSFLHVGGCACHVVSLKLLKLLSENEISGFLQNEIECTGWYDKNGKLLDKNCSKYKELIVTGRAGYLKNRNGKEIPKCPRCGAKNILKAKKEKGFIIDEGWDGSDMFYFKNWIGVIIVTEKVKQLLEKNKMKNVIFEKLDEFTFS